MNTEDRSPYRAGHLQSLSLEARAAGSKRTARSHHENTGSAAPAIGVVTHETALVGE